MINKLQFWWEMCIIVAIICVNVANVMTAREIKTIKADAAAMQARMEAVEAQLKIEGGDK